MNRIITVALIAGGLLLLDSPEAAAHKEVHNTYQPSTYFRVETRRVKFMPLWLKRNHSFRNWYKHSRLRKNAYLTWYQLFDIYRWQSAGRKTYRHSRHHVDGYYRNYERNDRRRHRH